MSDNQSISTLESNGWKALSTSQEAAVAFYDGLLREDARMLFPGGIELAGKSAILDALASQPWESFDIQGCQEVALDNQVRLLTYRVIANREGADDYEALISSVYVQIGGRWKLAFHQQTPV